MAPETTVVNAPGNDSSSASVAGWIAALVIVAAVVIAGVVWYRAAGPSIPNTGTNVNVELPNVTVPSGGGDGGGMTQ